MNWILGLERFARRLGWRYPLLIVVLYTAAFTLLFFTLPNPLNAQQLAFLPVALLAWHAGFPRGAVVGGLTLPFHTLLINLLGIRGWDVALIGSGAINLVALFWIGGVIGGLRDLREQLDRKISQLEITRQQLSRSESRWRVLFEAIPDSILRIGHDGTFLDFKASQDASVLMPPHFFLGKSIEEVLPGAAEDAARTIARALESGEVERFDYRLLVDGSERDYEAQIVAINDREVLSISRDITHRKRMEARLQAQLELETAIATVARTFLAQPDPDLSEILGLVAKPLGVPYAEIVQFQEMSRRVGRVTAWPGEPLCHREGEELPPWWIEALEGGRIVLDRDRTFPPEAEEISQCMRERGFLRSIALPIRSQADTLLGFVACYDTKGGEAWLDEEIQALQILAEIIGIDWQRRLTQTALEISERRFEIVFAASPDPILLLDPTGGQVLQVNPACSKTFGPCADRLVGSHYGDLFSPDEASEEIPLLETVRERGSATATGIVRCDDCTTRRVALTAVLIPWGGSEAVFTTFRDITEQYEAEKARRQLAERHRRFFEEDLTGDFIASPQGEVLFCNSAFARILGFSSVEAVIHVHLADFWRDRRAFEEFRSRLLDEGRLLNHEFELIDREGRVRYIIGNVFVRFGETGETEEIQGYFFDNSERKELERQLLHAGKMEAIGRLTQGIAHEFKNWLTCINGFAELLLAETREGHPLREKILKIREGGEKAFELTRALLAFGRRQELHLRHIDPNEVVEGVNRMIGQILGSSIECTLRLDPAVKGVKADPGQIEQVLVNLVINARDAMGGGGRLTIETANVHLDRDYAARHVGVKPGDYTMIAVTDTGCGMDRDTLAHVFDPFFTTKPEGEGTGLGLATAYGIVKQSGGNIWAYSEPGKGTTFKVYLPHAKEEETLEVASNDPLQPASSPQAEPSGGNGRGAVSENPSQPDPSLREAAPSVPEGDDATLPSSAAPSEPGGRQILVVDDMAVVRDLAREILEEYGYHVIEAPDGRAALELLERHPHDIALVLSDLTMPEMDGGELARAMQSRNPEIKFLFMSGYAPGAVFENGLLDPPNAFIEKPFSPERLIETVDSLLKGTPVHGSGGEGADRDVDRAIPGIREG